jgi:hypothetical protein
MENQIKGILMKELTYSEERQLTNKIYNRVMNLFSCFMFVVVIIIVICVVIAIVV